jgi:hypothetical protein
MLCPEPIEAGTQLQLLVLQRNTMRVSPYFIAAFLAAIASQAVAQERQWSLDQNDKEAYLAFGTPETDDVGVSFWCKLQSGTIHFYAPETDARLKIAKRVRFTIVVPPKSFRLIGKTTANEQAGSISLESELKISDPLFAALQDAEYFVVKVGKSENNFPFQDADFAGLLKVCKKH